MKLQFGQLFYPGTAQNTTLYCFILIWLVRGLAVSNSIIFVKKYPWKLLMILQSKWKGLIDDAILGCIRF